MRAINALDEGRIRQKVVEDPSYHGGYAMRYTSMRVIGKKKSISRDF
jgi:hypothetical protein